MLGIHQSFNGLQMLAMEAKEIGANTFQCFLRNNRNLKMRSNILGELPYFQTALDQAGITKYVIHAPYVINPASAEPDKQANAERIIHEDLVLLSKLPYTKYYVLHPGSALDIPRTEALLNLFGVIMRATCGVDMSSIYICLETMAGQGTQLIKTPFELKGIMSLFAKTSHIRVCFDTAHVFESGFDVCETWKFVTHELQLPVGVLHLNQSLTHKYSHVDRHANITSLCNTIPISELKEVAILADALEIPVILETPSDGLLNDYHECKSWLDF